jgi:hypothetical protein
MVEIVSADEVQKAQALLRSWGKDYRGEIPRRIHSRSHGQQYGLGSAPPFAPEFVNYVGKLNCKDPKCRQCREDLPIYLEGEEYRAKHRDERTRVTRAFRKLRRAAPLEFDVLYLAVMHGLSVEDIAEKLTSRAVAGGHEERYDTAAITLLAVAGVDKVSAWF